MFFIVEEGYVARSQKWLSISPTERNTGYIIVPKGMFGVVYDDTTDAQCPMLLSFHKTQDGAQKQLMKNRKKYYRR